MPTNSLSLVDTKLKNYVWIPCGWDHDSVQSLKSDYTKESRYGRRAEKLKDEVRRMLVDQEKVSLFSSSCYDLLKLINIIQRLGIGYHFSDEIKAALCNIKDENNYSWEKEDLCMQAVRFRLLRQHGYEVSQDVFKNLMEKARSSKDLITKACMGNYKGIEGILSLYEASFYAFPGENILNEVQEFTSSFLKEYLILIEEEEKEDIERNNLMRRFVSRALELPLHWRMQRLECKWFIETYAMMREDMNPLLLELATLDFNIVQANHQEDLKFISRWWQELNYVEVLKFSRDRWVENFFWTIGYISSDDPNKLRKCGMYTAKLSCLLTTLDDMNELFVSGDERKIFYDALERWDINNIEDLPYSMKICFVALFNTINDIAYDILKRHGFHAISYLRTTVADFWKRYFEETNWHEYTPTLEEYLDTAWVTAGGYLLSTVVLFALVKEPTKDALESITNDKLHDIRRYAFEIVRLTNDLETSSDELARNDTPTAIQCVMHERGVTESVARQHIKQVISETWKKMNGEKFSGSVYPELVVDAIQGFARACHCIYQFGDGYGVSAELTRGHIISLFLEPIPMAYVEAYDSDEHAMTHAETEDSAVVKQFKRGLYCWEIGQ